MTFGETLAGARARLRVAGIEESALEAEVLVMEAAGLSRASLYASMNDPAASASFGDRLNSMLSRRCSREPLAQILGRREFFGLDFQVNPFVLIPRQETESLVELTIGLAVEHFNGVATIVDVGTGSGAIAISLATALDRVRLIATDVSREALEVASSNAARHGVAHRIGFRQGDLLDPLDTPADIIVANLPYVTEPELRTLAPEIRIHEPRLALAGGRDGLDLVRELLKQISRLAAPPRFVALELGEQQIDDVLRFARALLALGAAHSYKDLSGAERGVILEQVSEPAKAGL